MIPLEEIMSSGGTQIPSEGGTCDRPLQSDMGYDRGKNEMSDLRWGQEASKRQ